MVFLLKFVKTGNSSILAKRISCLATANSSFTNQIAFIEYSSISRLNHLLLNTCVNHGHRRMIHCLKFTRQNIRQQRLFLLNGNNNQLIIMAQNASSTASGNDKLPSNDSKSSSHSPDLFETNPKPKRRIIMKLSIILVILASVAGK